MSFKVNFNIKEEDIRKLELISQTDGYLKVLRMNSDWASLLESRARIEEAVSSIGIEGTIITIDQAKAITVGDEKVLIGEKERREFVGYYESLNEIKKNINDDLTFALLLKMHEMITRGDEKANPGKIRTDQRAVGSKNNLVVYTAPPPNHLDFLLKEFISWFNLVSKDKETSPVIAASICHFWFVWIHPFCDGNGRVSRLLTTFLLLKKKSEGIKYFALSDYYNRNKDSYYNALEKTNICNPNVPSMNFSSELTPWVSYFIGSYLEQMEGVKEVTNRILQLNIRVDHLRKEGLITELHNKVLSLLSSREKASYDELQKSLGDVSRPRVHQILKPLRDANILTEEKIGSRVWFRLGAPDDEPDETVFKKKLKTRSVDNSKKTNNKDFIQGVLPIFD